MADDGDAPEHGLANKSPALMLRLGLFELAQNKQAGGTDATEEFAVA